MQKFVERIIAWALHNHLVVLFLTTSLVWVSAAVSLVLTLIMRSVIFTISTQLATGRLIVWEIEKC